MDFSPSERVETIRELAQKFLKSQVEPLESVILNQGWTVAEERLPAVRERAKETGLFAPHMPEAIGGGGLSLMEQAQLSEVLGGQLLGHLAFNFAAPDVGNMELIHAFGSPEQKERYLEPLVKGETRSTFLMTEPEHAGSNPVWMSTTAKRDGDDWVIRGHKWFATGADGAAFAVVMAVTDPDAENPFARASMFLVPTDIEGFALVRNISVMGQAGGGWASHGEVMLHGVRVPNDALLGMAGGGFMLAQSRLGPGRIHHASRWVGVCRRALDMMCRHAVERELAPGKPLGTRQTIQEWIAESRAEVEALRLLVLQTAWKIDRGDEFRDDISLIKFHGAAILQRILDRAIQVHGALGMTDDTPLALWYSHERAARIYDGPDEVHKRVLARGMLRRYGLELRSTGKG